MKGDVKDASDTDLFIITDDTSSNYSERIREVSTILDNASEFRYKL